MIKIEKTDVTTSQPIYDVLISGAGPVGLLLACELALAQCSVLILEKAENPHSPLKQVPFGIRGLSAPTIEMLYRRDILKDLELHKKVNDSQKSAGEQQKSKPRRQGGHFAGIPFLDSNIDQSRWKFRIPGSTDTSLISEMAEIERALTRRAEGLGVKIRRGIAISGFHQSDDLIAAESSGETFTGKWLVGCDGARSAIRKASGFKFEGTEPEFTGYSISVDLADPEKLQPGRNVTPDGMYMQSQPGYIVIQDFDRGVFHDSGLPITLKHLQQVLRRVSNTDIGIKEIYTATTWTDRARQSTRYRDRRVLLAGDAAHIHAPLGGQGLNLGLGDAMNLGWKLASTIKGRAPEGLLDTYYAERFPIGEKVLEWSHAQAAVMDPSPQGRALNAIIRDLMDTVDGATYFAGRVWGVNFHYDFAGDHPLVGQSVPNFQFKAGKSIGELMYDGRGILLDFDMNDTLQNLANEYVNEFNYIAGKANEQLGLGALLIRPDGIVAWAADQEHPDPEGAKKAVENWFLN
ncbi:FAD-dependent monooxygenase [Mucilaginibacter sp.]|uniref:FAD-dependent monooxygenase n=1 Tax=Mucilaginibacter sp. TaxID=1882438 RepID=UPI003D0AE942